MADIHDYLNASKEADSALNEVRSFATVLRKDKGAATDQAYASLLVGEAIALAIRELGTRLDYVLRDVDLRQRRG